MAALLAAAALSAQASDSMIGIGRSGDHVLEIFAERSEVVRTTGTATVTLPREAEGLFLAADVRTGDGVWTGEETGGAAPASVVILTPSWRSCTLKLKEAVHPAPVPVERFHILPWSDLGGRFTMRLDALARTNEAAYRSGLADVLSRARTVFGGQDMVAGFPGTRYAAEFGKVRRAFDRCVRQGQIRGFSADRSLKADYLALFGEEWPKALPATFLSGDDKPLEIRRIADSDGNPLADVFESPLPIRLDSTNRAEGVLPAGTQLQIGYAVAADGSDASLEHVISWRTPDDGGLPVWFVLQAPEEGSTAAFSGNLVENAGSVAVAVKITMGDLARTCTLPADSGIHLCLVTRPGTPLALDGEPDASDRYAQDWIVTARKVDETSVCFDSQRKEPPELVLSNPEMWPVDITLAPVGAGWGETVKRTLRAGETGVGLTVPAHRPLVLSYRFRSDFHKAGRTDIPALFHGDRTNLVLHAELKGDPEVIVQNTGTVAVRLAGMATPAEGVEILPGRSATVTVPTGRRTLLTGTPADPDWFCEPVSVSSMDAGESTSVRLRLGRKPAPQIVLRNAVGMMDVEATLMSGAGKPLARVFTVKRGSSTRPMPLPDQPSAYYRLVYNNGRFTAQGRLDIPAVPRGETRTLDIPDPSSGIRLQTSEAKAPAASAAAPVLIPAGPAK